MTPWCDLAQWLNCAAMSEPSFPLELELQSRLKWPSSVSSFLGTVNHCGMELVSLESQEIALLMVRRLLFGVCQSFRSRTISAHEAWTSELSTL